MIGTVTSNIYQVWWTESAIIKPNYMPDKCLSWWIDFHINMQQWYTQDT